MHGLERSPNTQGYLIPRELTMLRISCLFFMLQLPLLVPHPSTFLNSIPPLEYRLHFLKTQSGSFRETEYYKNPTEKA